MTFSASWTKPSNITNRLVGWVARLPARVQTKLLIAFLSIVGLLIVLGAVGLQVLSGVNDQTNELIKLQRKIAAYRQVQHDTTNQLYSISRFAFTHGGGFLCRSSRTAAASWPA